MELRINSSSSGKYHREKRGGRNFVVTKMLPIVGDTVMNGLMYPLNAVYQSYNQLDKTPAPAGHPHFNGKGISAFDPEGGPAFNVGAFVRAPEMNGAYVVADLVIDEEVANQTEAGKEIINRIINGKKIAVSTGLKAQINQLPGRTNDGTKYRGTVNEIAFDHVAILLDETPAGESTYTLNSSKHFKNQRAKKMEREIVISTDELSLDDHLIIKNAAMHPQLMVAALTAKASVEEAETIITNAGKHVLDIPQRAVDEYLENRSAFGAYLDELKAKRAEKISFVLENSEMLDDDLAALSDSALDKLVNSVTPKNKHITAFNSGGNTTELDLSALEA